MWVSLFQRVLTLTEEEGTEGKKIANSVQIKVSEIVSVICL